MTHTLKSPGRFVVDLPTVVVDHTLIGLLGLRVEQSAYMHDLAVVHMKSRSVDWYSALAPGTPIKITWNSQSGDPGTFVGYVSHVRPKMKGDDYYRFDVIATGASRILRATAQKVWRNKSYAEIAQEIAKKFGLNPIVEQHGLRKAQVRMTGESYWEFLSKAAKEIGYGLWVDGVNMYFAPISSLFTRGMPHAPLVSALGPETGDYGAKRTVISESFTTAAGITNEHGFSGNQTQVVAMSPTTGTNSTSRGKPGSATKRQKKVVSPTTDYITNRVAHTKKDAQLLASGAADLGLMSVDGHLTCAGTSGLKPFFPVYLEMQNYQTSGWWITKSVVHEFNQDAKTIYVSHAVVSTDSLAPSAMDAPPNARTIDLGTASQSRSVKGSAKEAKLQKKKNTPVEGKTSDLVGAYQWVAL